VREAYELIFSRRVPAGPPASHCLPLDEFQTAFDLLLSTPKRAYKVVFTPAKHFTWSTAFDRIEAAVRSSMLDI